MRVLCCVPTYVEAENIVEFLERARAAAPDADFLVIDDNSPDGTAEIAEETAARLGRIEVLRRPAKAGNPGCPIGAYKWRFFGLEKR